MSKQLNIKKTRKHKGIHQTGGNKGKLKKGFKYSGKRLKSGLPQIIQVGGPFNNNESFIHFGCWNYGKCDTINPENNMSLIMKNLLSQKTPPKFYIIAGDNYYPEKEKEKEKKTKLKPKKKFFNQKNLKSGFDCVKKLKAPVYMLMGNHDLQEENNLFDFDKKEGEKLDKCAIITEQLQNLESNIKFNEKSNIRFNEKEKKFNDTTLILMINSMFYTSCREKLFECFRKIEKYKKYKNINEIQNSEEEEIKKISNKYKKSNKIKNIIIVGHDPILSRRDHTKDKKKMVSLSESGINFLNTIYSEFPNADKYYLCADVHHYQKGIVTMGKHEITQYVVGTGGTKLDEDCLDPFDKKETVKFGERGTVQYHINQKAGFHDIANNLIDFRLLSDLTLNNDNISHIDFRLLECEQKWGYLLCQNINNELKFKFISL